MIESKTHQKHAIVIGGSISGLLAARVLRDFYENVTVLERDPLTETPEHRRGVPHGRHAHGLLAGGQRAIENLLPGISTELIAAGAIEADPLRDGTWFFEGGALLKTATGCAGVLASRPLLESTVRRRVQAINGIAILPNQSVRALLSTDDRSRVTGVVTDDGIIGADLVVDATGRGSRSSQWLEALGFPPAREEKIEVQLVYTTRIFKARPDRLADKFVIAAPTPDEKRGGVIAMQEGGTWICTLFGHFGNVAPDDLEGFIEYASTLPSPLIYEAIRNAEPVGEAVTFRFPASTRRHYEELRRLPEGYLVFGDAICSFNPIYGQGMSVAALQSETLAEALDTGTQDLARRFFRKAAKVIDNSWSISVGADLKMPETIGPRSVAVNAINWYIGQVHRQAHTDPVASIAFTRVAQLLESPPTLMRPAMMIRVLAGAVGRKLTSDKDSNAKILRRAVSISD